MHRQIRFESRLGQNFRASPAPAFLPFCAFERPALDTSSLPRVLPLCAARITLRSELIGRGPNSALMFCAIADGLKPLAEVQSASVPQP